MNIKKALATITYCNATLSYMQALFGKETYDIGYDIAFTDRYAYDASPQPPPLDHPAHFVAELLSVEYFSSMELFFFNYKGEEIKNKSDDFSWSEH